MDCPWFRSMIQFSSFCVVQFLRFLRVKYFCFLEIVRAQYVHLIQFVSFHYLSFIQFVRVHHPWVQYFVDSFVTYVFPVVKFFMPLTVTSILLLLLLSPSHVPPRVDAAAMINFNLINATSTLEYDIEVDLSFHNSHWYVDAQYLDLTAVLFYGGTWLGNTVDVLPVFIQRHMETSSVHMVFHGMSALLSPAAAQQFAREAADGFFNVRVTVASVFMYDLYLQNAAYYYDHECHIRFPVQHDGGAAVLTPGTICNAIAR